MSDHDSKAEQSVRTRRLTIERGSRISLSIVKYDVTSNCLDNVRLKINIQIFS